MNSQISGKDHRFKEKMDALYLEHMIDQYMEYCGDELLKEEALLAELPECEPSDEQMKRLMKDMRAAARISGFRVHRIPKRLFPLVAALIALLAITLITAGAFRSRIFNLFNVSSSIATEYGDLDVTERTYEFTYIPNGFSERFYETEDDSIRAFYINTDDKDSYFIIYISSNAKRISADTEGAASVEEIEINDMQGTAFLKDELMNYVWTDHNSGTTYLVQSSLSESETSKIAAGIKEK